MNKRTLLIYGAGAIGRGYIPWVFSQEDYAFYYVETNANLRHMMNDRGAFSTFRTMGNSYESQEIKFVTCFSPGEERELLPKCDVIVTAVGPRNFLNLRDSFTGLNTPIICCENDANLPLQMRKWTGNPNVVFAIPDVITSNTASESLLNKDPLSIITENGQCFIDETVSQLPAACFYINQTELSKQWAAKLFIHNTPHCIAAYLGSLLGARYLHESMRDETVSSIVEGAMDEMVRMLLVHYKIDKSFLLYYRDKELSRFRNQLLFDPIARVAREPFRKLAPNERLIGAAQLCLSCGIIPDNILSGIMAAFCFDSPDDPDSHIKHLIKSLGPTEFLRTIMKLRENEALALLLVSRWDALLQNIEKIKYEHIRHT